LTWETIEGYKSGGTNWLFILKGKDPQKIEQKKTGEWFKNSIGCPFILSNFW
jgi:hypothetical protein